MFPYLPLLGIQLGFPSCFEHPLRTLKTGTLKNQQLTIWVLDLPAIQDAIVKMTRWREPFLDGEFQRKPLGVAPSQDASDHQDYYIFYRESRIPINLHLPLLLWGGHIQLKPSFCDWHHGWGGGRSNIHETQKGRGFHPCHPGFGGVHHPSDVKISRRVPTWKWSDQRFLNDQWVISPQYIWFISIVYNPFASRWS